MSLSEQEEQRRKSREEIIDLGIDPYPSETFDINTNSQEIKDDFDEKKKNFQDVSISGRIMSRRVMGSASFAEIQDSKGKIQIYVRRDDICEGDDKTLYNTIFKKKLDLGDIIGITGYVFKTQMGETTIHVTSLKVLSKSVRPLPVVKETTDEEGDSTKYDVFSNKELKYRRRYIDLIVNPESREIFRKRSAIINEIRNVLNENNFLEVETPILQPIYGGASARPFKHTIIHLISHCTLGLLMSCILRDLLLAVLMVFMNLQKILEMKECQDFIILNSPSVSSMLHTRIMSG